MNRDEAYSKRRITGLSQDRETYKDLKKIVLLTIFFLAFATTHVEPIRSHILLYISYDFIIFVNFMCSTK
jgi:hypothetical protein